MNRECDGKEGQHLRNGSMMFDAPLSLDNLRKAADLIKSWMEEYRKGSGQR